MIGLHFFSPANVMKLLEVVRGEKTAKDVLATVMAMAKKIKKTAVVSGVCDGFIGNRMIEQYGAAGRLPARRGRTPQQVDKAIEKFGFAMGPFRMGDLAGNDIGWADPQAPRRREARTCATAKTADLLCEHGPLRPEDRRRLVRLRGGQARRRSPTRWWSTMIEQLPQGARHHAAQDQRRRDRAALVYALVNEGAHILEERHRQRAPATSTWSTSPATASRCTAAARCCYADIVGLSNVVRAMKRFAAEPGADASWQPAPLLAKLAADGKTFN